MRVLFTLGSFAGLARAHVDSHAGEADALALQMMHGGMTETSTDDASNAVASMEQSMDGATMGADDFLAQMMATGAVPDSGLPEDQIDPAHVISAVSDASADFGGIHTGNLAAYDSHTSGEADVEHASIADSGGATADASVADAAVAELAAEATTDVHDSAVADVLSAQQHGTDDDDDETDHMDHALEPVTDAAATADALPEAASAVEQADTEPAWPRVTGRLSLSGFTASTFYAAEQMAVRQALSSQLGVYTSQVTISNIVDGTWQAAPTEEPTVVPTTYPTSYPTAYPTSYPTAFPTAAPTTLAATAAPTVRATTATTIATVVDDHEHETGSHEGDGVTTDDDNLEVGDMTTASPNAEDAEAAVAAMAGMMHSVSDQQDDDDNLPVGASPTTAPAEGLAGIFASMEEDIEGGHAHSAEEDDDDNIDIDHASLIHAMTEGTAGRRLTAEDGVTFEFSVEATTDRMPAVLALLDSLSKDTAKQLHFGVLVNEALVEHGSTSDDVFVHSLAVAGVVMPTAAPIEVTDDNLADHTSSDAAPYISDPTQLLGGTEAHLFSHDEGAAAHATTALHPATGGAAHAAAEGTAVSTAAPTHPPFSQQLTALQDDDPTTFGAYGNTGVVGEGSCMGGYVTDLDLYLDCTQMFGFLAIVSTEETDLEKLAKLTSINYLEDVAGPGGSGLYIGNNTALNSTHGLGLLSFVAGSIVIEGNDALQTIDGVGEDLQSVGSDDSGASITITNNAGLLNVGQWELTGGTLPGGITIEENLLLQQITGMTSITSIGGALNVNSNPSLMGMPGFFGLVNVGGGVSVMQNAQLEFLGLESLETAGETREGESLVVLENDNLRSIDDLHNLQGFLLGAIKISGNQNLQTVDGLRKVVSAGMDSSGVSVNITNNERLEHVDGLGLTGRLNGSVIIMLNPSLKTLAGFQYVSEIGVDKSGTSLEIAANFALENLMGFEGLNSSLAGALVIQANDNLCDISQLGSISSVGSLSVGSNPSLPNLEGLSNVKAITGTNIHGNALEVILNARLTSLDALMGLNGHLKGALVVQQNPSLHNLSGLENVRAIDGANLDLNGLVVTANTNLTNLEALTELTSIYGGIFIGENSDLDNILPLELGLTQVDGSVTVHGVKCISVQDHEVLSAVAQSTSLQNPTQISACQLTLTEAMVNFGDSSLTEVGDGEQSICGGHSSNEWLTWSLYGSTGLFIHVDTSSCNIQDEHPRYVTSMQGDNAHWQLLGVNSIYNATKTGFRLYLYHPVLRGAFMQYFARQHNWKVNWLYDSGRTSGMTSAGQTGWKALQGTENVVYADVNTAKSMYGGLADAAVPRLVTSLHGSNHHWKCQGAHAIYERTRAGFRMFIVYPTEITPEFAEQSEWSIAWIGSQDNVVSGESSNHWKRYVPEGHKASHTKALFVDVDTTSAGYPPPHAPAFVTSVSGKSHHWRVTGAGSIYHVSRTGFRVYLDRAESATFATKNDWRVNYIAWSAPIPCEVSGWTGWGACSLSCNNGTSARTRIVTRKSYFGGACDDALAQQQRCNLHHCPAVPITLKLQVKSPCFNVGQFESETENSLQWIKIWTMQSAYLAFNASFEYVNVAEQSSVNGLAYATTQGERPATYATDDEDPREYASIAMWVSPDWRHEICEMFASVRDSNCVAGSVVSGIECGDADYDCAVGGWASWGSCSLTCGGDGLQLRTRPVLRRWGRAGSHCPPVSQTQACNNGDCPVHCQVSNWESWTPCTRSCDGGSQQRSRTVVTSPANGGFVCPDLEAVRACKTQCCPVDCHASGFTAWTACTVSCGAGWRTRTMTIVSLPSCGGALCGAQEEQELCNPGNCPVHCTVGEWNPFGPCSKSCGAGKRVRRRRVVTQVAHNGTICPNLADEEPCNAHECPEDCTASEWSDWSTCTSSCQIDASNNYFNTPAGTIERHRHLLGAGAPLWGGAACPHLSETLECNRQACPIDCVNTAWTGWSACSRSCHHTSGAGQGDRGMKWRMRQIAVHSAYGGSPCGVPYQQEVCDDGPCPVHCQVTWWGNWSPCTKSCGVGGLQMRARQIKVNQNHDGAVCPPLFERRECNTMTCPVDCVVSQWSPFTACPKSCKGVFETTYPQHSRYRAVLRAPRLGGADCASLHETAKCNTQHCPIDCVVSGWSEWAPPPNRPWAQKVMRTRTVLHPATDGGAECAKLEGYKVWDCHTGNATADAPHGAGESWWIGEWSGCSHACGGGTKTRNKRTGFCSRTSALRWNVVYRESAKCNTQNCTVDQPQGGHRVAVPPLPATPVGVKFGHMLYNPIHPDAQAWQGFAETDRPDDTNTGTSDQATAVAPEDGAVVLQAAATP
jgi:hypothetical protein